jgi:hypothetical protein
MKTRFIKIDDVSDIDTTQATVYDLSNRYIDNSGNMYGLKYNRETRKIEIVRLMRTPAKHARYYEQKVHERKRQWSDSTDAIVDNGITDHQHDTMTMDSENIEAVELEFNPEDFIEHAIENLKIHKDRLQGIMMNITNSHLVKDNDRVAMNYINDMYRNLDIDGIQRIDKILDSYTELKNYPRSLIYYQSKLDTKRRNNFDEIPDNNEKMNYIFFFEMWYSIRGSYRALEKMLSDLQYFIEEQNADDSQKITQAERQHLNDATTSIKNTLSETESIKQDLNKLENYLDDISNFM